MTDQYEAMREEFEKCFPIPLFIHWNINQHAYYPDYQCSSESTRFVAKNYTEKFIVWRAATIQSAEKIARLEAELAAAKKGFAICNCPLCGELLMPLPPVPEKA